MKSINEYEAVSSITSFNNSTNTKYFLSVSQLGSTGDLQSKLTNYSINGFRDWHLEPLRNLPSKSECISVFFSNKNEFSDCSYSQKITWLVD